MDNKLRKQIIETKYLNVENTDRYRSIIRFLYLQFGQIKYWTYPEDIYEHLKQDEYFSNYSFEQLSQDLDNLVEWKNLEIVQDTKNFKTIEEYKNKRYRYQLKQATIEIERFILTLENMNIKTFSLEPTLIERIATSIKSINKISLENPDKNFSWWESLYNDFTTLNNNYRDYMKELESSRTKDLLKTSEFLIFKSKLIEYLTKFISSLQWNSALIEEYLHNLDKKKTDQLFENIISYGLSIPTVQHIDKCLYRENILGSWESIKEWFMGTSTKEPETIRISVLTDNIIRKITKYALRITELSTNSHSRKKEYSKLATLFYQCHDIQEAHKLSSIVFGLERSFKLKFSKDRNTDSINSSVFEESPAEIRLVSKNIRRRDKLNRSSITDNTSKKEQTKKEIFKELNAEKNMVNGYLKDNKLKFADLPVLSVKIRNIFLNWLARVFENEKFENTTEYGRYYYLEDSHPSETCILKSTDGDLVMPAFVLIFEPEINKEVL
ncbi:hypothetical protein IX317_001708 [Fusobacterium sp. DD29]|uniref:TIGR02677 family protein n=1 Tax=unclassified Fusobacterium TaxID=2648384 RepID=UPI001B8C8F06|nr:MULTISPECIES: TIGR02677 family protein [unclassified Fusobacterium]MBR8711309.1 hypothetical protein [Fusobacterium sp. DD28]MBR8750027.1 hypothetical protein [Fusobacterium sp. DD29]MBR8751857.1 hypothetical protein [Fusobacterium sp. DD26]MBR8762269.1 hypothetical protein [Fusobacterium sp. DD25]MBR8768593.1 hypothetical protein [Fusobacterium sp. DD43]